MARPRRLSDDAVLDAARRALATTGPARLTLGAVALEAGLAPATLVQRFGSKRGLLRALAERGAADVDAAFAAAATRTADPHAALVEGLVQLASPLADPRAAASSLAFLALDAEDDALRDAAAAHLAARRAAVERLLLAGGARPDDPGRAASTIVAVYDGTLVAHALAPASRLDEELRAALALALRVVGR